MTEPQNPTENLTPISDQPVAPDPPEPTETTQPDPLAPYRGTNLEPHLQALHDMGSLIIIDYTKPRK